MALRKLAGLIRISTKAGLAGGTVYLYYEAGLWRGTDETIENYAKLQKDVNALYEANPDVKKWVEYISSSVSSNVKPYTEAVGNFRKEWLDFDLSGVKSPVNGIVKPAWNKGLTWTVEAVADSPVTIQNWGAIGWQKITELTAEPDKASSKISDSTKSSASAKL